jgi:hypothetical protein
MALAVAAALATRRRSPRHPAASLPDRFIVDLAESTMVAKSDGLRMVISRTARWRRGDRVEAALLELLLPILELVTGLPAGWRSRAVRPGAARRL